MNIYVFLQKKNFSIKIKNNSNLTFLSAGILLTSHSPPSSTPLEPCRVAPYVNVPSLRGTSTSSSNSSAASRFSSQTPSFSAFDPAILSAAHQVSQFKSIVIYKFKNIIHFISLLYSMPQPLAPVYSLYHNTHSI